MESVFRTDFNCKNCGFEWLARVQTDEAIRIKGGGVCQICEEEAKARKDILEKNKEEISKVFSVKEAEKKHFWVRAYRRDKICCVCQDQNYWDKKCEDCMYGFYSLAEFPPHCVCDNCYIPRLCPFMPFGKWCMCRLKEHFLKKLMTKRLGELEQEKSS